MFESFNITTLALSTNLPSVRTPGSILSPIAEFMSIIYNMLFDLINNPATVGTLGIAIIIFTLIVKTALFPLTLKQQKSAFKMRALQPELDKIKDKYKGKTDQLSKQKMAIEMQDFQKENGVNLFGGCLPLLLQMPILYAMFYIFQNAYVYVDVIGANYVDIANAIIAIPADLRMEIFAPFAQDFAEVNSRVDIIKTNGFDLSITNDVVMLVNYIKVDEWDTIISQLGNSASSLTPLLEEKHRIETFLTIPLVANAGLGFPGILIPLIAGGTTFLQSKIMTASQPPQDPDNPATAVTKNMMIVMPFMMGFFCISMPAGLGLYWTIGNIYGIVQQLVLSKVFANKFDGEAKQNG